MKSPGARRAEGRRRTGGRLADNVRLVTASVSVSALGTWSYNVGIAVYAWRVTNSASWVAAATVGRYVPALLLTGFTSKWIDRFPRRRVAVLGDLSCALAMVLLTVVAAVRGPIVLAIALAAISSAASRIQSSAVLSVAADVIVESQLVRSTVLISSAEALATAIGPAFASAVLALYQPSVLFAINGATFVVSAAILRRVEAPPPGRRLASVGADPDGPDGNDVAFRAAVRAVWPLLATRATAALVYGFDVVLLAVIATRQLRDGTTSYGLMLAASGAGGLLVALALRRSSGSRAGLTSFIGMALYAVPVAIFVFHPALLGNLSTQLLRGIGAVMVTAPVIAGLQRAVPSNVSGRIFSLNYTLVLAGTCVGAVAAPLALHAFSLNTTLLLAAFVPFALQLAIVPGTLRFDRGGALALADLDPRVNTLRRLELFRDASRATLYDVADSAVEQEIQPGVDVVREGDEATALFILLNGDVDVTKHSEAGEHYLRRMTGLAYFGEIGIIHSIPRTATVRTVDSCRVWRVPAAAFLSAASRAGLSNALSETVRLRIDSDRSRDDAATTTTV